MENRITHFENPGVDRDQRSSEPQRIGIILAELLAQYQTRFPEVRIAVVETPVAAV